MPVAGVVVLAQKEKAHRVMDQLRANPQITLYGLHDGGHIIAVFEAPTPEDLERLSEDVQDSVDGVLGVFPAYVHFEAMDIDGER